MFHLGESQELYVVKEVGSADCNDTYAESPPGRNSRASRR